MKAKPHEHSDCGVMLLSGMAMNAGFYNFMKNTRMEALQTPLSKVQLELLFMFNNKSVSDEEWGYIKKVIADFFAKKSLEAADKAWEENSWDDAKVEGILKLHLRTPYNPGNQLG